MSGLEKIMSVDKLVKKLSNSEKDAIKHKIMMLNLRGMTAGEIARHSALKPYGFSSSDIKMFLESFEDNWKADNKVIQEFSKLREMKKTELLEREAWIAYEKSKQGVTKTTTKAGGRDGEITVTTHVNGQENIKALELVLECVKERNKMIGNYAPAKAEHSGSLDLKQIQINYHAPLPTKNDSIDVEYED